MKSFPNAKEPEPLEDQAMNVDAILCADTHLRSDTPRNRIDDFTGAMKKKFEFILALGAEHHCPILIAGDLGHRSTWPWPLYSWFVKAIKKYEADIICIPGQHDEPNHKLDKLDESPMGVSNMTDVMTVLKGDNNYIPGKNIHVYGFPWGTKIVIPSQNIVTTGRNIAMTHQMVIEDKPEWKGQEGATAKALLKNNDFDLILSGDNHKPFVTTYGNKVLVNPGSMMRSNIDQANHEPRVYLYDAEINDIQPVYLPIEDNVFKEAGENSEDRKKRFEAFIESINKNIPGLTKKSDTVSFEDNAKSYFENNRVRRNIKERVWEIIDAA